MISFTQKGDFSKTARFLRRLKNREFYKSLSAYGEMGVKALADATPKRSGKTAESWRYDIYYTEGEVSIVWSNTNENKGRNIAILIQYGHGTRNGGYVQGIDFINPAMKPVFDEIADSVWREVTS